MWIYDGLFIYLSLVYNEEQAITFKFSTGHWTAVRVRHLNGEIVFVPCKLGYEKIAERQLKCMFKLQQMGFQVEIHRLVDSPTKTRLSFLNIETKEKIIKEYQQPLKVKKKNYYSLPTPSTT